MVEYPVHTRYVICSSQIAATRPVGQAVKTPPFHGGNMGSIPVRVTTENSDAFASEFFVLCRGRESKNEIRLSGGQSDATSSKTGGIQYCDDSRTGHEKPQAFQHGYNCAGD